MTPPVTTAVVLAAGSSRRLGRPKQTLPFAGTTLLGATLDVVRSTPVDQRIVTLGGAHEDVRDAVDLRAFEVVEVADHADGCSASIVAAVDQVHTDADGIVLLLGDQPGVRVEDIVALVTFVRGMPEVPDAVVLRYDDGLGHPFWLGRATFPHLRLLHGDKAVWKLLESGSVQVHELARPDRTVPLDVDTWDDYKALCAAEAATGPT